MTTATRLATDMSHCAPVTRHYQVDGGHLAVTVLKLFGNGGTTILYADENGAILNGQSLVNLPEVNDHAEALQTMGYTVVDDLPPEPEPEPEPQIEQSVLDMLPPEIAAMIPATEENSA